MISFADFQSESFDRQVNLLYQYGSCVMSIRYYGYKINLYLLGNFYLEVFYNHKKDMIEKIVPLDVRHSRFNFYTDQIRLPATL
ncbi:MAG: hypothetical protein JNL40_10920 [Cyclobacteriaceae bacterium]|nr:hypothetical protein [Cyclobacteriaceae bacterium]